MPDVHISFPIDDGDVPGGGGFFAWGTHNGVDTSDIEIRIDGSVVAASHEMAPSPCTWAVRINNGPSSGSHTFKVTMWEEIGRMGPSHSDEVDYSPAAAVKKPDQPPPKQ